MGKKPDLVSASTYGEKGRATWQYLFDFVFGSYPVQYRHIVADSAAKREQYGDMLGECIGEIRRSLHVHGQARVLEIGTSPLALLRAGLSGLVAESQMKQLTIVSLDRYSQMLNAEENGVVADFDGDRLPFPVDTFDVVFFSSVLLYIENKQHALLECARVLRGDGVVVFSELDRAVSPDRLSANVLRREIAALKQRSSSSAAFYLNVLVRFGGRLRYLVGTILRNRVMVKEELAGFSADDLRDLLRASNLEQLRPVTPRTYADSYWLQLARKRPGPVPRIAL